MKNTNSYRKLKIPDNCFPKEHYETKAVYRVVKRKADVGIKDFLPSKIEFELRDRKGGSNLKKLKSLKKEVVCAIYSCSFFEDLDKMIIELNKKGVL